MFIANKCTRLKKSRHCCKLSRLFRPGLFLKCIYPIPRQPNITTSNQCGTQRNSIFRIICSMYSHIGSWHNTNIPPKIRLMGKVLMNFIDRPTHFSQHLLMLIPLHSNYNHCSLSENLKGKNPKKCKHAFFCTTFGAVAVYHKCLLLL